MRRLYFKRKFVPAILSGEKTTTLRRWRTARIAQGDTVMAPNVGCLCVTHCEQVELKQLKTADARADGFVSLAALMKTVEAIYPDHKTDGKQWFRVGFKLAETHQTIPSPPRRSAKLGKAARRQLATAVRAELDKAVRLNGSLVVI